ncbi:hypothetical protein, partial [Streptomyces exfoliatus]|uniref:hypothetical protein n=1 Tax=Streptomyces exfoliatus TaxID=1905 RepID=UPI000684880D
MPRSAAKPSKRCSGVRPVQPALDACPVQFEDQGARRRSHQPVTELSLEPRPYGLLVDPSCQARQGP